MQVTHALVQHLARLSRLHFTDEEIETMKMDMERMTAFVAKLEEVDTAGVQPLAHMAAHTLQLHDDEPAQAAADWNATAQAGRQDAGYFLVPKVIDRQA